MTEHMPMLAQVLNYRGPWAPSGNASVSWAQFHVPQESRLIDWDWPPAMPVVETQTVYRMRYLDMRDGSTFYAYTPCPPEHRSLSDHLGHWTRGRVPDGGRAGLNRVPERETRGENK